VLFVARGEAPEVLDAVKEALDAVARAVEHRAEAGFAATVNHRRDVGRRPGGLDLAEQPVGVIGLVGERDADGRAGVRRPGRSPAWPGVSTSSKDKPSTREIRRTEP
jgi:hypothetical protein